MARIVNFSSVVDAITLDGNGVGVFAFTVTSILDSTIRIAAKVVLEDPTRADWVQLEGPSERTLAAGETDQFTVRISAPAGAAPRQYRLRLMVYAVDRPGEDYSEGPSVSFAIPAPSSAENSAQPDRKLPWWMVIVVALVLLAGGGGMVAFIFLSDAEEPVVEQVVVPDLLGLTEQAATDMVLDSGLTVAHVLERPAEGAPRGSVIAQDPSAGTQVDGSLGVTLTVAAVDLARKEKICGQFAEQAVEQNRQNIERSCDLTGAEWSSDYGYHFSKCDRAADYAAVTKQLFEARQGRLDACLQAIEDKSAFCAAYGDTAVEQQRTNTSEGCGLSGAPWSDDRQYHVQWCASLGEDYRDQALAGQELRSKALRECEKTNVEKQRACSEYAKEAIKQQAENLAERCGFEGPRWQSDYDVHYDWCLSGDRYKTYAPAESRARQEELATCRSRASARCELYEHSSFKGGQYEVARNQMFEFAGQSWNDRVSSVKVPEGCTLTVYRHLNLTGESKRFSPGAHQNVGDDWNDHITSGTCTCK